MLRQGLTVLGDVAVFSRHFLRAAPWLESARVHVGGLIARRFSLDEYGPALETTRTGKVVREVLEMWHLERQISPVVGSS